MAVHRSNDLAGLRLWEIEELTAVRLLCKSVSLSEGYRRLQSVVLGPTVTRYSHNVVSRAESNI